MADVIVAGANLLFSSKVTEAARVLGLVADVVSSEKLQERVAAEATSVRLLLLDLDKISAEQIRIVRAGTSARLVGFDSHGQVARLEAAREAGCDEVLSRGQFSARLPSLLDALKA
jgi:hypothetical protein